MRMRSRPVARLVPMSFISSCRFTSQAPRGSVCASPRNPAGLFWMRSATSSAEPICSSAKRAASAACSLRGLAVSRNSESRRCSRRVRSQGKVSSEVPPSASGRHWAKALRAACTSLICSASGVSAMRKAQSAPLAPRSSSRLRFRHSSTPSRRMFWKSTAILVQTTSIPRTGLGVRPVQASAARMSEAVKSAGLSGGGVVIEPCLPGNRRAAYPICRIPDAASRHGVEDLSARFIKRLRPILAHC